MGSASPTGPSWKQIALDVSKTSAIRKAASQLLNTAAWPIKTPRRKRKKKKHAH